MRPELLPISYYVKISISNLGFFLEILKIGINRQQNHEKILIYQIKNFNDRLHCKNYSENPQQIALQLQFPM